MNTKFYRHIATLFGLGYSKYVPGTLGSLAGLGLCLLLHGYFFVYVGVFIALFSAGVISSRIMEDASGEKDPSFIIIDEFACVFIVFLSVPITPLTLISGFAVYRLVDIFKIPPLKLLERQKGGWGIMLDDLAAAVYANLILRTFALL